MLYNKQELTTESLNCFRSDEGVLQKKDAARDPKADGE